MSSADSLIQVTALEIWSAKGLKKISKIILLTAVSRSVLELGLQWTK